MNERDIFLAALEQPTAEARTEYLSIACEGDSALRQRVVGLLQMHENTGDFLQKPLVERLAEGVAALEDAAERSRDPSAMRTGSHGLEFLSPSDKPGSLGRLGHYEVQEVIGSGGMGIVLRAFDEQLHRVVAIKVMAAPLAASAASRKRFQREARAAAAVCHDHIVTIHAVEESGDLPYLVMQCISGLSLQQRIDRDGPLELHEILRIGMQTAAGLAAAHAQGLIHRDIKPANILLENGVERVRITDFGLARAAADASISQSGAVIGTPQYMAPEQARGEALDGRTDLFSLGSVLYAMCTGRAPFRATNSIAVLKRVCEEAPSPIREANADIPEWLVALIDKLQAKNPGDRYQTAAEVAELLGQRLAQLQNTTALSPMVTLRPPPARAAGRGWRRWAFAAAAVLVLAASFGLAEGTGATKFTATVIRLLTPEGTLVVEMTDPEVKVTIDGDGGLVITGVGQHVVHLKLGRHTLQADKDGKPVPLDQELVTITRDDKPVVRVRLEGAAPSQAAAIGEKDAPPSAIAPFDAATAKEHQEAWAKHLGVPVEFTNSVGMKFRLIPPGEFEMGSTSQDIEAARAAEKYSDDQVVSDALTSEGPIHRVVLSEPFYLSVTEVTQEDFETVTGENPSTFRPGGENAEKVRDTDTAQLPVQGTSWNAAANFCSRLSMREGLTSDYRPVGTAVERVPGNGYRLPREAQWEFACRAGTTTCFWFGKDPADHANREWLRANSEGRPHTVGSLAKNPFGVFDMHGNVSEWCQDGWNPEFYLLSRDRPAVDPLSKPQGRHQHMVRGGAWTSEPAVRGRSAFRMPAVPSKQYESNGLRVVLTVESARRVIERSAQGAFVVLDGKGVEVRKFDTLADAVQSASDGDTIEIRGNGPFASKPISIGRTALTIRAGAGFRPVIKPSSEGIEKAPYLTTDAALVLEGLDFHAMFPREDQKYPGGSIQSKNASLRAANCRFHGGIWMIQSPVCVFRNCEFLIGNGWWGCCGLQISSGARILCENCLSSSSGHAMHLFDAIDATDDVSIQITRSTFASKSAPLALSLQCPRPAGMDGPKASKPIRLEVSRSIFDSTGILAFGQQQGFTAKAGVLPPGEADAMLLRLLEWRGEWNLFPADSNSIHWYTNFKAQPPRGPKGLDEWKKFSGSKEVDSRDGRPRFHGGSLLARANLDQLTPEDFRLRPDSDGYRAGPDGKDLGADVDLVGPGPSYERWKKTPEYQQWLKDTKQVAKSLDPDRKATEWVLSVGGGIYINGIERDIKVASDLPQGVFQLTAVGLSQNPKVSDAGLAYFKDCKNLTGLVLNGNQVNDAGLAYFKDCKNLMLLNLAFTQVSDAGLAHFKDCRNLRELRLNDTQVGDAGLAHFKDCKNLTHLGLEVTKVSDAGLAHFKDCKNLTHLNLHDTQVSDAGLIHIQDCKALNHLVLHNTQVSDAGLERLAGFPRLTWVKVEGTKVTEAGVKKLAAALPKCKIDWPEVKPFVLLTDDAAKKEQAKWQGEWENPDHERLIISGDRWSWHPQEGPEVVSTIKIVEVTDKMTHVLLLNTGLDAKVRTIQAILRVDGDTLHNCGTIGSIRPTEFAQKAGYLYVQWKRVAKTPP